MIGPQSKETSGPEDPGNIGNVPNTEDPASSINDGTDDPDQNDVGNPTIIRMSMSRIRS